MSQLNPFHIITQHLRSFRSRVEELEQRVARIEYEIRYCLSKLHDNSGSIQIQNIQNSNFAQRGQCNIANDSTASSDEESSYSFSKDIHSMLDKGLFMDVSISCGSEVFRAHKSILSARSPVFEAMFLTPMLESEKDMVVINDLEPQVFKFMLVYMYSNRVEGLNMQAAYGFVYAAEKYQLEGLKKNCVQYMRSNLSVDNAFNVLQCADLHDKQLKSDTLAYICKEFSLLKVTQDWNNLQLSNPPLALEIYSCVVEMLQKENVFCERKLKVRIVSEKFN